jgi:subtilisin family serine protease/PKD repeat protein
MLNFTRSLTTVLLSLASLFSVFAQSKSFSAAQILNLMQKKEVVQEKLVLKWRNKPTQAQLLSFSKSFAIKSIQYPFDFANTNPISPIIINQTYDNKNTLNNIAEVNIAQTHIEKFINYMSENQLVDYVEPVGYIQTASGTYTPNDVQAYQQWGLAKTKVLDAWAVTKGNPNTVIGIIDVSFQTTHPDLRNNLAYNDKERQGRRGVDDDGNGFVDDSLGYDFAYNTPNVQGVHSHGTQVAGIAAAQTDNRIGVAGVGFNCKFLPIKVQQDQGLLFTVEMLAIYKGILYAANQGCQVINISLVNEDLTQYYQYQQDIIDYVSLVKKSLVVAGAGNARGVRASELLIYPAAYNHVLSVTGSDIFDNKYSLGNYNHLTDLMAPGVDIFSTHNNGDYFGGLVGTSYAVPFVAGAAALIKSHFPELTGLQVGELLRVNTDDIYSITANTDWKDKLGTGRLNVIKAINNRNTSKSVRYRNFSVKNNLGNFVFAGDSIDLPMSFTNLLQPIKKLKVTLEAISSTAMVVNGNFETENIATLDSVLTKKPFKIYISPTAQPNENLIFKLNFTDEEGYKDYQYFVVRVNNEMLTLARNAMTISTAANGRLGYVDVNNKQGAGIVMNDNQYLKEAGLLLGANSQQVSNSIITTPTNKANHFKTIQNAKWSEIALQHTSIISSFSDDNAGNRRIGITVNQKLTQRINTPNHRYTLVEYTLTNNDNENLDSLSVGLFADFDILNANSNIASWDNQQKIAFTYRDNQYAGVKVFGGNGNHCFSIDKINDAQNPASFSLKDSFSIAEKFFAMNNATRFATLNTGIFGSDVAQVVATKVYLPKGTTQKVAFVIMLGNSLTDLQVAATSAATYINNEPQGELPIISTVVCAENLVIQPKNGDNFRFYSDKNLGVPLQIGKTMKVSVADSAKTYYISNVDKPREGELLAYKFKIRTIKPIMVFNDSLNIFDSARVHFWDYTEKAVSHRWHFGDGVSSTLRNPQHTYKAVGRYWVQLTVTDSFGCTATVQKLMRVVRLPRSLVPIVPKVVSVCAKQPVTITPSNGKNFKFYADSLRYIFLGAGENYKVQNVFLKKVYVTGIDSVIESSPVVTLIDRTWLDAKFSPSQKADTILFETIAFEDKTEHQNMLMAWEWDFGDGKGKSNLKNPTYKYDKQGVYRVKLKVWDRTNCTDTISQIFKVGKKSPLPNLPEKIITCPNKAVMIAPQNGTSFSYYTDENLLNQISSGQFYSFVPTHSQDIYVVCQDSLVESEPKKVRIEISNPKISINIPKEVKLYETEPFTPTAEHKDIAKWQWNFGDGKSSTLAKPAYHYQKQGNYQVTVTVTDIYGCLQIFTSSVIVINRAAKPIVTDVAVCKGEGLTVRPQGGSIFGFYTSQPSPNVTPITLGRQLILQSVQYPQTLYVVCYDSLAPSLPASMNIAINEAKADFIQSADTINIFEKDTLWLEAVDKTATVYQWLINGIAKNKAKNYFTFTQTGTFDISFTSTNNQGCVATTTKRVVVINDDTSNLPPFTKLNVYPNPSKGGDVTIDLSLRKPKYVYVHVYNAMGQLTDSYIEEYFKDKTYTFKFANYSSGLYLIKFVIGDKQVIRKVLVEY